MPRHAPRPALAATRVHQPTASTAVFAPQTAMVTRCQGLKAHNSTSEHTSCCLQGVQQSGPTHRAADIPAGCTTTHSSQAAPSTPQRYILWSQRGNRLEHACPLQPQPQPLMQPAGTPAQLATGLCTPPARVPQPAYCTAHSPAHAASTLQLLLPGVDRPIYSNPRRDGR